MSRFEAHLTVDVPVADADALARVFGMRVTHIVLATGSTPSQVLLTARFDAPSRAHAVVTLRELVARVREATLVIRVKLELDLGDADDSGLADVGQYAEAHVKVRTDDIAALGRIGDRFDAHVSRSLNATASPSKVAPSRSTRSGRTSESLRVHFPVLPPLTGAYARAVPVDVGGTLVPVVDRLTLTLAELLSQRQGAEQAVVAAVHGGVDPVDLARELAALAAWPEIRSPYVLRTFDRKLARERLDRSARAA